MPVKNQYSELLKMSSPCEKLIRRDIARTYPEHEFFKGQDSLGQEVLFNVMKVRPPGPTENRCSHQAWQDPALTRMCSLAGLLPGGPGGGLLPGQRLHRGPAPHAGRWPGPGPSRLCLPPGGRQKESVPSIRCPPRSEPPCPPVTSDSLPARPPGGEHRRLATCSVPYPFLRLEGGVRRPTQSPLRVGWDIQA